MKRRSNEPGSLKRLVSAALLMIALAACGPRPGPDALTPTFAEGTKTVTIYAATTRQRAVADENVFNADRAPTLNYAEFTISIPPNHKAGEVEYPIAGRDPKTAFVTVSQQLLDQKSFYERIARAQQRSGRGIGVFVHGFNTNFQEALFRLAQMAGDADVEGVPILFAWPSRASIGGYVADRDSVAYSRDYLADTLTKLAAEAHGTRVLIFGHSMGGWLTMEAVRQLRLAGRNSTIAALNVVLAAPDIDIDVFRTQVAAIGPLEPPLTVLVSKDDRALSFSAAIGSERPRAGAIDISDPRAQEAARLYRVRLIDISKVASTDSLGHDRYSRLAALYPRLAESREGGAGTFVFDSLGNTLASPFTLAGRAFGE